jgi:hypothetical protein
MGDAKLTPNPFISCKNRDFGLFWLDRNNHGAIGSADKNWDCLIAIQTLNQALKLLYPSDIGICNPNNDIPWANSCPR